MAILNFMVFFPGKEKKETRFIEKIHSSLIQNNLMGDWFNSEACDKFYKNINKSYVLDINTVAEGDAKLHTIREDKTNRWKAGMLIDFFINARTKNMLRFAPRVKVVSVQKIEITYFDEQNPKFTAQLSKIAAEYYNEVEVVVDNEVLNAKAINELVKNDGFVTPEDFFAWFNKDFSGKIIHWTDLKY